MRKDFRKIVVLQLVVFISMIFLLQLNMFAQGKGQADNTSPKVAVLIHGISASGITVSHEEFPGSGTITHPIWYPFDPAETNIQTIIGQVSHNIPLMMLGMDGNPLVSTTQPIYDASQNGVFLYAYGQMMQTLQQQGITVVPFIYDWRLSSEINANKLNDFIENIVLPQTHAGKVTLVCHSMGGIVGEKYLVNAKKSGVNRVEKFISIGTPYFGTPKALFVAETGNFFDASTNLILAGGLQKLAANMRSMYELLPNEGYFNESRKGSYIKKVMVNNNPLAKPVETKVRGYEASKNFIIGRNFAGIPGWTNAGHIQATEAFFDSMNVRNILGKDRVYAFVGDGKHTVGRVVEQFDTNGNFLGCVDIDPINGDGTVPLDSAKGPWVDDNRSRGEFENDRDNNRGNVFYIRAEHSELVKNNDVIMKVASIIKGSDYKSIAIKGKPTEVEALKVKASATTLLNIYDNVSPVPNHLGPTLSGKIDENIPGGNFYSVGQNQVAFLDSGEYNAMFVSNPKCFENGVTEARTNIEFQKFSKKENSEKSVKFSNVKVYLGTAISAHFDASLKKIVLKAIDATGTIRYIYPDVSK